MPPQDRPVLFCLVSPAAAEALDDVTAHYAGTDPRVRVVMERRGAQRRRTGERPAMGPDRRAGTDRRRFFVARTLPSLPPALAERTGPVRWLQRLVAVGA